MTMQSLDPERIIAITGGDKAVEEQLFTLFFASSERCVSKMEEALAANDLAAWKSVCHEYKGASASLGAVPLSERCGAAEQHSPNPDDFEAIRAESGAVCRILEALLHSAS